MNKKWLGFLLLAILSISLSYYFSNSRKMSKKTITVPRPVETNSLPAYFKVPSSGWQRAYMSVGQINIDGSPNNYRYSISLPPDMRVETDKDGKSTFIIYKATDGYEYAIYPSDMAVNNIVGPAMDDVDKWITENLKFGELSWESHKVTFKSNNVLNWYLNNTESDGERKSFEATIPLKDRDRYIDLVGKIISSYKIETTP